MFTCVVTMGILRMAVKQVLKNRTQLLKLPRYLKLIRQSFCNVNNLLIVS
ncbi:hypothetical protein HanXRQr2_Chr05g0221931 [Helianthus annuus]|uniref:Uncharacterized protein n=1 Tax=Helianthus annuus TaxID=4232 RepID=A0A9K3J198_HELAN|nr:hypothetical protein HanXRQr2_Chr05g0221931 [Helianthus annuus]